MIQGDRDVGTEPGDPEGSRQRCPLAVPDGAGGPATRHPGSPVQGHARHAGRQEDRPHGPGAGSEGPATLGGGLLSRSGLPGHGPGSGYVRPRHAEAARRHAAERRPGLRSGPAGLVLHGQEAQLRGQPQHDRAGVAERERLAHPDEREPRPQPLPGLHHAQGVAARHGPVRQARRQATGTCSGSAGRGTPAGTCRCDSSGTAASTDSTSGGGRRSGSSACSRSSCYASAGAGCSPSSSSGSSARSSSGQARLDGGTD